MKPPLFTSTSTLILAAIASGAAAQSTTPDGNELATVVVTGTREQGVTPRTSSSPIAVIEGESLSATGQPNLIAALNQLVASYNYLSFPGGDLSNLVRAARLRGLSPNHTLVLVNGRRRHASSIVNATPGPAQGSSPVDLDLIPLAAIDRVEVLQDGAAAQYGSDAIAGVINIILKSDRQGGVFDTSAGAYYKGDGEHAGASLNAGFGFAAGGFLNLTAEARGSDPSNRTGPDPRITSGDPNVGKAFGDPESRLGALTYNAGTSVGDVELYSFGTYAERRARSYQNYRLASDIPAPYFGTVYPNGYIPRERIDETDGSLSVGVRGKDLAGWQWDLATTWGANDVKVGVEDSINLSLLADTGQSPTRFDAGRFRTTQWTTNLDVKRSVDVGLVKPLLLALGAEHRRDSYRLQPGDPASRYQEGTVAYPGFSLTDAGDHSRSNTAAYVNLAAQLTADLKLEGAVRQEHYSDFGASTIGKLAGRYALTPKWALRSTLSNGFAAPSLPQQYFSTTNVGLNQALVQLPANSEAARIVGATALRPEKSRHLSLGLVGEPVDGLLLTVDAYRVDLDHRIVNTGYLIGPQATAAIVANGNVLGPNVFAAATYFTNAVDTRTDGVDISARFTTALDAVSGIDWTLGANYNHTSIRRIDAPPPSLSFMTSIFDPPALNALTRNAPQSKAFVNAFYKRGVFGANLRATRYGSVEWVSSPTYVFPPFTTNVQRARVIVDLDLSCDITPQLTLSAGANNLFNVKADATDPASLDRNVVVYVPVAPFGFNGGAYYALLSYRF